jgi:hypothetical protein
MATKKGEILVFQGNGFGDFADPGVVFGAPGIETARTADLDGDGRDEIIVASPIPGIVVLPGN